ncbi:MAG: dUTP diphosphatase [Candidatus Spechtbacterales bacterium]
MTNIFVQKMDPSAKLPSYSYEGDAGMDLFSFEDVNLEAGGKALIATGIKVAIPKGYAGFVWDKSGIAVKHHIKTMAGVIDSNYRGELKIALTNLGKSAYQIKKGEKIAQLIVKPVASVDITEVQNIETDTERGEGGFGSSGML